jgi:hypothetical protein
MAVEEPPRLPIVGRSFELGDKLCSCPPGRGANTSFGASHTRWDLSSDVAKIRGTNLDDHSSFGCQQEIKKGGTHCFLVQT